MGCSAGAALFRALISGLTAAAAPGLHLVNAGDGSREDYHYDETGNTLFLSDETGGVAAAYAYGLYGDPIADPRLPTPLCRAKRTASRYTACA